MTVGGTRVPRGRSAGCARNARAAAIQQPPGTRVREIVHEDQSSDGAGVLVRGSRIHAHYRPLVGRRTGRTATPALRLSAPAELAGVPAGDVHRPASGRPSHGLDPAAGVAPLLPG